MLNNPWFAPWRGVLAGLFISHDIIGRNLGGIVYKSHVNIGRNIGGIVPGSWTNARAESDTGTGTKYWGRVGTGVETGTWTKLQNLKPEQGQNFEPEQGENLKSEQGQSLNRDKTWNLNRDKA